MHDPMRTTESDIYGTGRSIGAKPSDGDYLIKVDSSWIGLWR